MFANLWHRPGGLSAPDSGRRELGVRDGALASHLSPAREQSGKSDTPNSAPLPFQATTLKPPPQVRTKVQLRMNLPSTSMELTPESTYDLNKRNILFVHSFNKPLLNPYYVLVGKDAIINNNE